MTCPWGMAFLCTEPSDARGAQGSRDLDGIESREVGHEGETGVDLEEWSLVQVTESNLAAENELTRPVMV